MLAGGERGSGGGRGKEVGEGEDQSPSIVARVRQSSYGGKVEKKSCILQVL